MGRRVRADVNRMPASMLGPQMRSPSGLPAVGGRRLDEGTLAVRQGVREEKVEPDTNGTYPGGRRNRVVVGELTDTTSRWRG